MITIDQLLESVNVEFEPRWVTKDQNGYIELWETKPHIIIDGCWGNSGWRTGVSILKLAEFNGKDWTECIYEVPRKEERTKWIGKLCRFWDGDKNCFDYGILKKIDEGTYITNDNAWYYHCEPVRPDDDVIYKDAVNELKGAKNG